MKISIKNVFLYVLGIVIMALSVVLMKKTNFGMGAWDAVIANISTVTKIKLGYSSFIVNIILLSFVIIYRKNLKFILVIIPIVLNTLVLNFIEYYVLQNLVFNSMFITIIMFVISVLILPLGLALVVISTLPKMIYEEITYILMELIKTKRFGLTRLLFEFLTLILAMFIGLIGGDILMQIGIGTVIVTFTLGFLIDYYMKIFIKIGLAKDPNEIEVIELT